jgi:multicomponent Na+:H+ antiporter subunit C
MAVLLAIAIGMLYSTGIYMMFRRSSIKLVIGLGLIGHAANLLIFTSAGLVRGNPPFIGADAKSLPGDPAVTFTDPLPPALILTAIVIGFALSVYTIVLIKRAYQELGTDDLERMRSTDA